MITLPSGYTLENYNGEYLLSKPIESTYYRITSQDIAAMHKQVIMDAVFPITEAVKLNSWLTCECDGCKKYREDHGK